MSLVVVGSIAFDAVKTPFGERERMLGGSAVHFSLAASFFTDVRVVGPVGDDFGESEYDVLRERGVNTDDIEHVPGGKTFFWKGRYEYDLNTAHTEDTQLGVFGNFEPKLSDESRSAGTLFLANIQPDLQRAVRELCPDARLVGPRLDEPLDRHRARLAPEDDFRRGPGVHERRRGAHAHRGVEPGARCAQADGLGPRRGGGQAGRVRRRPLQPARLLRAARLPARGRDRPTGAGGSFAGSFLGYLDSKGPEATQDDGELRRAMTYGSVLASFNVEEFGTERVRRSPAARSTTASPSSSA